MLRIYFCSLPIDGNTFDLNQHRNRNRNKNRITYCKYGEDTWRCDTSSKWCHPYTCILLSIYIKPKSHKVPSQNIYKQSPKFIVIDNISVSIYFFRPYFLTITLKFSRQMYALLGRSFARFLAHPHPQTQMQSKINK